MNQLNTLTILMGVSLLASCTNQISFDPTASPQSSSQEQSSADNPSMGLPDDDDSNDKTPRVGDEEDDVPFPNDGQIPDDGDSSGGEDPGDTGGDQGGEEEPPQPVFKSETFFQVDVPQVDILFIDDNSRSMKKEQEKMGSRFSSFMKDLNDVDWHIGVTTTDITNGLYGLKGKLLDVDREGNRFITPQSPDPESLFLNTIVRPEVSCPNDVCPSGNERPLEASIMAMRKHDGYNQGFFRDGVDLAIVVLTDEDEGSKGSGKTGMDVLEEFKKIWGETKNIRGYGVITRPGDVECLNNQGTFYANYIDTFITLTGGVTGSICDEDYSQSLERISEDVKDLILTFELSEKPFAETVQLTMEPEQSISWSLKGRKLIFETAPISNTKIMVDYQVDSSDDPQDSR